jgi:hypothetical protein
MVLIRKKEEYITPNLDFIQINVEHGFAQSGGTGEAGGLITPSDGWDL